MEQCGEIEAKFAFFISFPLLVQMSEPEITPGVHVSKDVTLF